MPDLIEVLPNVILNLYLIYIYIYIYIYLYETDHFGPIFRLFWTILTFWTRCSGPKKSKPFIIRKNMFGVF